MGRLLIVYDDREFPDDRVGVNLLIEADWTEGAVRQLIRRVYGEILVEGGPDADLQMTAYSVEEIDSEFYPSVDELSDGIREVHERFDETQKMVDELSETLSDEIDRIIEQQYTEIEDIVESTTSEQEKKEALRNHLKVGLERGLPTLLYELSTEDKLQG